MVTCEFAGTCPFLNKEIIDMPLSTHLLSESYCEGYFTMCAIHKAAMTLGISNAAKQVSPGDRYKLSSRVLELVLWGEVGW
jgi:hypothetical protein